MTAPTFLDAAAVRRLLSPLEAVEAITHALRSGVDPAATPTRQTVTTRAGQLLLMPAAAPDAVGVKLVSVAPGNAGRGLPRIQGVYVLLDADTLAPVAVLDGAALTTLRTPAVSVAAVRSVLPASRPVRVVVFGAGPQAVGHLFTLAAVLEADGPRPADAPLSLLDVDMVVRAPAAAAVPATSGATVRVLRAGSPAARRALEDAQLVVCATTSHEPLFPAQDLRPDAVVVAVGAHDPTALEVEPALAGRARVVVEDPATALREAGVVRAAVGAGLLGPEALVPMAHVVTTASAPVEGPVLFVSVGMAWEDLAVASAVQAKALGQGPG